MIDIDAAREEFKKIFPYSEVSKDHILVYKTKSGKEIALEPDRTEAYYVWIQRFDTIIEGIQIKNVKYPGQPYDRKQSRNSNLNEKNSPKLKLGNKVWYLEVDNLDALIKLIAWYDVI